MQPRHAHPVSGSLGRPTCLAGKQPHPLGGLAQPRGRHAGGGSDLLRAGVDRVPLRRSRRRVDRLHQRGDRRVAILRHREGGGDRGSPLHGGRRAGGRVAVRRVLRARQRSHAHDPARRATRPRHRAGPGGGVLPGDLRRRCRGCRGRRARRAERHLRRGRRTGDASRLTALRWRPRWGAGGCTSSEPRNALSARSPIRNACRANGFATRRAGGRGHCGLGSGGRRWPRGRHRAGAPGAGAVAHVAARARQPRRGAPGVVHPALVLRRLPARAGLGRDGRPVQPAPRARRRLAQLGVGRARGRGVGDRDPHAGPHRDDRVARQRSASFPLPLAALDDEHAGWRQGRDRRDPRVRGARAHRGAALDARHARGARPPARPVDVPLSA